MTMIDLNKIRDVKKLEEMKADLTEFLANPDVKKVYLEVWGWGEEDYDADREQAEYMLEQVERRLKSLSRFNQREAKPGSGDVGSLIPINISELSESRQVSVEANDL